MMCKCNDVVGIPWSVPQFAASRVHYAFVGLRVWLAHMKAEHCALRHSYSYTPYEHNCLSEWQ